MKLTNEHSRFLTWLRLGPPTGIFVAHHGPLAATALDLLKCDLIRIRTLKGGVQATLSKNGLRFLAGMAKSQVEMAVDLSHKGGAGYLQEVDTRLI